MTEPEDLDALLDTALRSYCPEPPPALATRVGQRLRTSTRRRWSVAAAALAAGLLIVLSIPAPPPPQAHRLTPPLTPAVPSAATTTTPKAEAIHTVRRTRIPHSRTKATPEERAFLTLARTEPEQFPRLVAVPDSHPIEPIAISDLPPQQPLVP